MFEIGFAIGNPGLCRLVLQVVAKPLKYATLVIDLIGFFAQAVVLAGIFDEDNIFSGASGDVVELDALVEKHGAVAVAHFDEQRRSHACHAENSGVSYVGLEIFIKRDLHALLSCFDVVGFGNAGAPMMIAVIADQVGDGRAGNSGGKEIRGVGGQIRGIEAAQE